MTALAWLVPVALGLGVVGLVAFLWSLKAGQFDDLEGAGWRALEDRPPGGSTVGSIHGGGIRIERGSNDQR